VRRDYRFDLLDALAARNGDDLLEQARTLAERGIAFDAALQDLGSLLTQLALLLHSARAIEAGADAERMQAAAEQLDVETVQLYYQIALNGRRDLPYAPDEFSGFCMTLLRMLAFVPGSGSRAVAADRPAPQRATSVPRAAPAVPPIVARVAAPDAGTAPSEVLASPGPIETASPEPIAQPAVELVARESSPHAAWDWLAVVGELRLGGMAKMLADHCELVSQSGDAVTLRVGEAHKHLLDRTYQDKLIAALRDKYGATLAVTIEIGAAADKTPQQVRTRIKQARQAEAVAAIEADPFVRELVDQFGGQLDATSIQPLGEHP
jgi:DNA polymerase-3 subunit gamma/tau